MRYFFLLSCLVAVVLGKTHLLISIVDEGHHKSCTFIEVSPFWEPLLKDPAKIPMISEEISHLIHDHSDGHDHGHDHPRIPITMDQAMAAYNDPEIAEECTDRDLSIMSYHPSAAIISGYD